MDNHISLDANITSDKLNEFLEPFPIEMLAETIFILDGFGVKLMFLDLFDNYEISAEIKERASKYYKQKEEDEKKDKYMTEIISNIVEEDQMW